MNWITSNEAEAQILRDNATVAHRVRCILLRDAETIIRDKPFEYHTQLDGFGVIVYAPQIVTDPKGCKTIWWTNCFTDPRAEAVWINNIQCLKPIGAATMSYYCRKCPRVIEEDNHDLCPDCACNQLQAAYPSPPPYMVSEGKYAGMWFRLLEEGETVEAGDQILDDTRGWTPSISCIGTKAPNPCFTSHRTYRRQVIK